MSRVEPNESNVRVRFVDDADEDHQRAEYKKLEAAAGIFKLLEAIGEDATRDGLRDTPLRFVRAFEEMTSGYRDDPRVILSKVFEVTHDEMIVLSKIEFVSLCEHHLMPFVGVAHVGYIPGLVVGISKLARLVQCYAKRLQIQERMTSQIALAITEHLQAWGVGVVVEARHACMMNRGVRQHDAVMKTSSMLGALRDKPEARAEFFRLIA